MVVVALVVAAATLVAVLVVRVVLVVVVVVGVSRRNDIDNDADDDRDGRFDTCDPTGCEANMLQLVADGTAGEACMAQPHKALTHSCHAACGHSSRGHIIIICYLCTV